MRKIVIFVLLMGLLLAMAVTVNAATGATHIGAYASVSPDGSCSVAMTVTLKVEQPGSIRFPVPKSASNISVNGSRVRTTVTDNVRMIDLTGKLGGMAGEFTLNINYSLRDVVYTSETGTPELRIPLLSGFGYPVSQLEFNVTLPDMGQALAAPHFSSGYHQADIEKHLEVTTDRFSVSGASLQALKDHETLVMTISVPTGVFPTGGGFTPDTSFCNTAMVICTLAAVVYWLVFLRNRPQRSKKEPVGPDGYGAGELGSVLTLSGADLTMMIWGWAKLGYVQIVRERRGTVTVHKQMEMGNERSDFERQVFRKLFSRRPSVNTASVFYAKLSTDLARQKPQVSALIRPRTGSKLPFRVLMALVGLFGGVNLGIALSSGAALKWFLTILLAGGAFAGSYLSQRWVEGVLLRHRDRRNFALVFAGVWLLLSFASGSTKSGYAVLLVQAVAGLMLAFGGKRTEAGKQAETQVLGLHRYLRSVTKEELKFLCQNDPEYFFSLAPEALALGMDRAFARRFGKTRLPECPYLVLPGSAPATATQWSAVLRDTVKAMDETAKIMPYRKIAAAIRSLRK